MVNDFYFDIRAYLESRDIRVKEKGMDIGAGDFGIRCPFPGCSDDKFHCGINPKKQVFNCWICGESGNVIRLVQTIEDCQWPQAMDIARKFQEDTPFDLPDKPFRSDRKTCWIPDEMAPSWPGLYLDYLRGRGFDPERLIAKYGLLPTQNFGDFRFRIIAPVFLDRKMVSFVGADVLRIPGRIPYLNCPKEKSIIPINHCFYNLDSVRGGKAIIVEGITDVWRLGDGAIASFTSNMTDEQILLLAKRKIQKAFVLYDPDAIDKAKKMATRLSAIIPSVERVRLDNGDPADMSDDDARLMVKDLLGG
jgi:DNA primase